jgi:DNA polymerase-4
LCVITPQNIDELLGNLKLRDLPGIGTNMAYRLERGGITTPLEMRYAGPQRLKALFKSIEGIYWHYRLNFIETNISSNDYKGMQAQRQISGDKRQSMAYIEQLFMSLCLTLEKRMVRHKFYSKAISFTARYEDDSRWDDAFTISTPVQDAVSLMRMIKIRIEKFEQVNQVGPIMNTQITSMRVGVTNFVDNGDMLFSLFEDVDQKQTALKTMHEIKDKFGADKLVRAMELTETQVVKDVIGFGSVKDLSELDYM